jgi:chloride channel protein, CIC family
MKHSNIFMHGIPISISLNPTLEEENIRPVKTKNKKRLFIISSLGVTIAIIVSLAAKLLVFLINFITNIFFHGIFSVDFLSPVHNSLGWFVIFIPVTGGFIVGLMAFYGSKAIRGHGIPEAMEQILMNQSKINPSIIFFKPISAAISIGTGGPFGAEGPIIATGGAMGSTIGQLLRISSNERKILLAAGATAGMSAIFGSPIAAIFLAIELLLFEFSPRSFIPVALACTTGAAAHYILFGSQPVFPMAGIILPSTISALATYGIMGLVFGSLSAIVTTVVYFIEDCFEKIPVHWMWWPAIGGLFVGIIGYYSPRTFGVGYENITDILSGNLSIQILLSLALLKFFSWAIALGSGTSGGTLAPLLTIGGATGALLGSMIIYFFPNSGITLPLSALLGMSAMFAGASRALLTSILFAVEATGQSNVLLPLLAACTTSYIVSFFVMENTIMTEKIARRGIKTPHLYEPDILEKITIEQVIDANNIALNAENTISEIREWLKNNVQTSKYFIVVTNEGKFIGIISQVDLYSNLHDSNKPIDTIIKNGYATIAINKSLRNAIEIMANEDLDVLPVVSNLNKDEVVGLLSYKEILSAYSSKFNEHERTNANISLKRHGLKILLHGQRMLTMKSRKNI